MPRCRHAAARWLAACPLQPWPPIRSSGPVGSDPGIGVCMLQLDGPCTEVSQVSGCSGHRGKTTHYFSGYGRLARRGVKVRAQAHSNRPLRRFHIAYPFPRICIATLTWCAGSRWKARPPRRLPEDQVRTPRHAAAPRGVCAPGMPGNGVSGARKDCRASEGRNAPVAARCMVCPSASCCIAVAMEYDISGTHHGRPESKRQA